MADPEQVGSGDERSPTTLVLNYLKANGQPLNGANIRTVLEESARNPGLIPGLRNDRPATEAEDQAAMVSKAVGGGRPLPVPPQLPSAQTTGPMDRRGGDEPDTSAQPTKQAAVQTQPSDQTQPAPGGLGLPPGDVLATLVPALAAAINRGSPLGGGQTNMGPGPAMPPTGRMTDVSPTALPPPGAIPEPAMQAALAPPRGAIAAPQPAPVAPAGPAIPMPPPDAPNVPFNSASPRTPPVPGELEALLQRLRGVGASSRAMGAFKFLPK